MSDQPSPPQYPAPPPAQPPQYPAPRPQQPAWQPPATQQPGWPAQPPTGQFATRTDQRVHQLAWAVFWLMIAGVCSGLAVATAITIVGAIVFGLAGFAFWVVAFVYSIMALSRR